MNIIHIKQEPFFPLTFRLFGFGLLVGGLLFIIPLTPEYEITDVVIGVALLLGGLILISARYGLLINVSERTYQVYSWWLGYKAGETENFGSIEKFYINRIKETNAISTFSGSVSEVSNFTYKAYMLLDTGEKVHVDTHRSEEKLTEKVRSYEEKAAPVLEMKLH